MISPAERWLKIRERACLRAQQRGFVGGDAFTDWSEAEKEVDAKYDTDPDGKSLTAPEQIASQFKCIFSRYGLNDVSVDALLEQHRQGMKRLRSFDQKLIDSTTELASRQNALAQEALVEVAHTLESLVQGELNTDALSKQAALSMQAVENALSHLKVMTEAITGISPGARKDTPSDS